jgi:adenylate cyclase
MSGTEIERKFLVRKEADFKSMAVSCSHIVQGYIPCESATVRIRVRDDRAYLTIKSHSNAAGLSRYEFEKQISLDEARHLLQLCRGGMIDKHRYLVPSGEHTFEVDEFHGDNDGLLMAEVELGSEDEDFVKPPFVGKEVTGDRRFYNSHLLISPYSAWKDSVPAEYR